MLVKAATLTTVTALLTILLRAIVQALLIFVLSVHVIYQFNRIVRKCFQIILIPKVVFK